MKKASHYHKEVAELNAFTLTKVMELLVIPQDEIVDFLDGYMITPSSTCREVREAVSAWKDDNIVADAEITDAEDAEDSEEAKDEVEQESKVVDEDSKQCDTPSAYFTILELVEKLEESELIALKEYIEKRL